jgi:hypothetical protein
MGGVEDRDIMERANAYARSVMIELRTMHGVQLDAVDVSRAFVVGFAAGLEAASVPKRTVRK